MARESRKDWNRETAGMFCGKVTPRYPGAANTHAVWSYASIKASEADPRFPIVLKAGDVV